MTSIKSHRYPDNGPIRGIVRPESVSMADSVHPPSQRTSSEPDESIVLMRVVNGVRFEPFAIGDRSDITKYFERDPERGREGR